MIKTTFEPQALLEYMEIQRSDKKMLSKVNTLLKDIARNPQGNGLGKPEMLKGDLSGYYSRRIDSKHRIVYRINDTSCEIVQIGGHYDDT
ncbi:Txe/YoeB family addiction module toxin [Helicobacter sp. MIT 01-3238]|uniref:Txe/YoeB family addiction module toxin n=1 Tax=Helicobacter sp. MIT 01-3238 TaxID=398627 RepID=UPI000E1EB2D7|nr:Txe/YoeB family addiction module toxin [Helicobacter sp. MIT 01-3238]RDU55756.1 Txe/YoeB family addiction module toxin [Helicobacter sp. MIT 01-3238]